MPRKKVAVVQPFLVAGGGTEAVTAWMLEALKADFDLTLVSYSDVDLNELNRYYGTELQSGDLSLVRRKVPYPLNRTARFLFLKDHLMGRYCRSVRHNFDLFINVGGVMDFGARGVQYMALAPGATLAKVLVGDRSLPFWYRALKRTSMVLVQLVCGFSEKRARQNTTLVTSKWAGELAHRLYGISDAQVVYPPVNSTPETPGWGGREEGFLCVARVSPEKRIERVIEILSSLRDRGFDISLRVIGRHDNPDYLAKLSGTAAYDASWVHLDGLLSRDELQGLMVRYKYGINAAEDEPFGIGLAELVTNGCIVFVPNSGGQTEIVDDPQLVFSSVDEAVRKIAEVLESSEKQRALLNHLSGKRGTFSTESFCAGLHEIVSGILSQKTEQRGQALA